MAFKTDETKVAGFELTLVNNSDPTDVQKRTINFDLPYNTTTQPSDIATIASTYFAVAGMSNVFQPNGWRDFQGNFDVYIMQSVKPIWTEKTVVKGDEILPPAV